MKRTLPLIHLGGAVLLALLLVGCGSWWVTGHWSPFHLGDVARAEARRREALEGQLGSVTRCTEAKLAVARKVAESRLTLDEGAEQFRELHARRDAGLGGQAGPHTPGGGEGLYRNVIDWVEVVVERDPARDRTTARLEAELGRLGRSARRG